MFSENLKKWLVVDMRIYIVAHHSLKTTISKLFKNCNFVRPKIPILCYLSVMCEHPLNLFMCGLLIYSGPHCGLASKADLPLPPHLHISPHLHILPHTSTYLHISTYIHISLHTSTHISTYLHILPPTSATTYLDKSKIYRLINLVLLFQLFTL